MEDVQISLQVFLPAWLFGCRKGKNKKIETKSFTLIITEILGHVWHKKLKLMREFLIDYIHGSGMNFSFIFLVWLVEKICER